MDPELAHAFRRGDHGALERVYRLYARDVEKCVRRALLRIGRLQPANLADIVQEVFLKAFSVAGRDGYDGLRDYAPYLMTIARNVFVDWMRRTSREVPGSHLLEVFESGRAVVDHSQAAEEPIFSAPVIALTNEYLAGLTPELRAVHQQRFVLGLPQRPAAEALGISRQSLRTLEKKLVVGLRRKLRRAGLRSDPERQSNSNPARDDDRKGSHAGSLTDKTGSDAAQRRQG
jgi:RNA polymerase sigma-70 factor (ECF subfamily)